MWRLCIHCCVIQEGDFYIRVSNLNPRLDTQAFEDVVLPIGEGNIRFAKIFPISFEGATEASGEIIFKDESSALQFIEDYQDVSAHYSYF